jgi:hypothetical protein
LHLLTAKYPAETLTELVPRDYAFDYWETVHLLRRAERRSRRGERAIAEQERLIEKKAAAKRDRDEARARLAEIERTRLWRLRTLTLHVVGNAGRRLYKALRHPVRG